MTLMIHPATNKIGFSTIIKFANNEALTFEFEDSTQARALDGKHTNLVPRVYVPLDQRVGLRETLG